MSTVSNQIDLQVYNELEKHLYGGKEAFSYFHKNNPKCLPFSQSTLEIKKGNGTANFGYSWSAVVDKDLGDYLSNLWLMVTFPSVMLKETNTFGNSGRLRWTENLMHNLIEECTISFNDVIVSKIDNFALDFLSEYNLPNDKFNSYKKFIGNSQDVSFPQQNLKQKMLFLPLPLFFCKDTGNSIPLSALPHTEIKINIKFRIWENLLILENINSVNPNPIVPMVGRDIVETPQLVFSQLNGNFITVSEEERMKIGLKSRVFVIEQVQTLPRQMISKEEQNKIDLLLKQSVKSIYFGIRNTTYKNIWSNYNYDHDKFVGGVFVKNTAHEILEKASIKYASKDRVVEMPSQYFRYINPWYHSKRIPDKDGIFVYNFCLDADSSDPCGGSSLSRIHNPTLNLTITEESKQFKDNFELIVVGVCNNVVRISEGMLHFPIPV